MIRSVRSDEEIEVDGFSGSDLDFSLAAIVQEIGL